MSMSPRVSISFPEIEPPPDAWQRLQEVLRGALRPTLDARSFKVLKLIAATPCDVRMRPGCFEVWPVMRGGRHQYLSELAAPVVHHLMRRLGLSRALEARVGLLERVGLGSRFGKPAPRAVWLVPHVDEVQIFLRDAPAAGGPRLAMAVPASGPWALPAACEHPEPHWVRADRACPLCKRQPAFFRELEAAWVCPDCGRSFERR